MSNASFGGASVSNVHNNFLINNGNASANDFEILGNMIIEKVKIEDLSGYWLNSFVGFASALEFIN